LCEKIANLGDEKPIRKKENENEKEKEKD